MMKNLKDDKSKNWSKNAIMIRKKTCNYSPTQLIPAGICLQGQILSRLALSAKQKKTIGSGIQ